MILFARSAIFSTFLFLFFIFLFCSKTYAALTPTPVQEQTLKLPITLGNTTNQKIQNPASLDSSLSASGLETLFLPANGTTVQSSVLENGQQYIIRISGTFIWGNCDKIACPNGGPDYKRYGDAGYLTDDHWKSFSDPSWSNIIYLNINGHRFIPDKYSSRHVYSLGLTGNGSPATFRINDCSYCYPDNSGFLTVEIKSVQKTPLILIPGIAGSELKTTEDVNWKSDNDHGGVWEHVYPSGEKVWVNNLEALKPGNDDYFDVLRMKPDGQTSEANLGLTDNLFEGYQEAINFFTSNGYTLNQDFFVFPYDWRRDIALTASLLDQKIQQIKTQTGSAKVDIIAHSMGGLVARNYIVDSEKAKNVRKLFTLGTPHLGAVEFLKALQYGICLKYPVGSFCSTLNPLEVKDILQNTISGFELAPSQKYFNFYSEEDSNHPYPYKTESGALNYMQIKNLLTSLSFNTSLFNPSEAFHTLDNSLPNTNDVDVTVIAGSGQKTLGQIVEEKKISLLGIPYIHKDMININGDETVPLFSASLIDSSKSLSLLGNAKVFYANQKHDNLVSSGPALNLVKNILNNDSQLPDGVSAVPYHFGGTGLSVHSPVNIHVYDSLGNHTGPTSDGDFEANIPGSSYDTLNDAKFIYLPDNGNYDIKFEAENQGSFDFKIRKYENDENSETILYKEIPLTNNTKAEAQFDTDSDQVPIIKVDEDDDGSFDFDVERFSILEGDVNYDYDPPVISFNVSPKSIWPPNNKMVNVNITGIVTDENPYLINILVDDEYDLIEPSITIENETDINQTIKLEAFRRGDDKDGRIYKVKILATDLAGNTSLSTTEVVVPHDQGK